MIFSPQTPGYEQGQIHIISNDSDNSDVLVMVEAVVIAADIELAVQQVDFGNVRVETIAEWPLVIINQGTSNLVLESISISDPHFSLDPLTIIPDIIAPLESKTIWLRFRPQVEDILYSAELLIYSNDYDENPVIVTLSEQGIAPAVSFSETSHDFGDIRIFATADWSLHITNTGSDRFIIENISITNSAFTIDTDLPDTVRVAESIAYDIQFGPLSQIDYAGAIQFEADIIDLPQVTVFGRGVASRIELSDIYHDFGHVEDYADWTFTVTNSGSAILTIFSIENDDDRFSLRPEPDFPLEIGPDDSRELTIRFASSHSIPLAEDLFTFNCDDPENSAPTIFVEALETTVAVQLADFTAAGQPGGVALSWSLFSADDLAGFYIYRSQNQNWQYAIRISSDLIVGHNSYTYFDQIIDPASDSQKMYYYWIEAITGSAAGQFRFGPVSAQPRYIPVKTRLYQNQPNPFKSRTEIQFELAAEQRVSLRVYSLTGQLVRVLSEDRLPPGKHIIDWDGRDERGTSVAGGLYFYRLITPGQAITKRMVLLR